MKLYYTHLRVYRTSDQNYLSLRVRWHANRLSGLEAQIQAFEAGLQVAGALRVTLEQVYIDYPQDSASYVDFDDPQVLTDLAYFLGIKRDRRKIIVPKTEQQLETDNDAE